MKHVSQLECYKQENPEKSVLSETMHADVDRASKVLLSIVMVLLFTGTIIACIYSIVHYVEPLILNMQYGLRTILYNVVFASLFLGILIPVLTRYLIRKLNI